MISVELGSGKAALAGVLCVTSLSLMLAPASPAESPSRANLPSGCGPKPSWIESATLPAEGQDPLPSCFAIGSSQAEVLLSILNNRPYAQLITVGGGSLDVAESSFVGSLEGALARLWAKSSSGKGLSAFLLGPGEGATLGIDRPPPGSVQDVDIAPAPVNAFAVGALAWALLNAAAKHLSLPAATQSCILAAVYGALLGPPHPERALRRIHLCVNAAGLPVLAEKLLRDLASRLLRDHSFQEVIEPASRDPHPGRIAVATAPSSPGPIEPGIRFGPMSFEVPDAQRTVERLSASGGTPPYRFYIVPEPGGPDVPAWLHLAPDGTLILEPPVGFTATGFFVEVVDSNGGHSYVPNGPT
jgi:hypothetical protein